MVCFGLGCWYKMGITGFYILLALMLSVRSLKNDEDGRSAIYPNTWPDFAVHGGFLHNGLMQPRLRPLEFAFPVPFLTGHAIDAKTTFAIKVMDSSWTGPAETNIYQRGEPVHLQVTSSGVTGQELYVVSCYAAPSANPTDKSRSALINKGCVSSKQPVMKFISRKSDSINLLLQTSSLKFSQMYVHCSVVLSGNGLTPETKSCNYDKNEFKWVELGGQAEVCDCCATKCRRAPLYVPSFSEYKVVSTGPLTIKEQEYVEQVSTSTTCSEIGACTTSEASSSGGGWIASGGSVSSSSLLNRAPLWTQPAVADSVMVITQGLGDASSFWLPELVLDVQTRPVLEFAIGHPRQKGRAKISMLSQSSTSTESIFGKPESAKAKSQKNPLKELPELESRRQELVGNPDGYVADAPDMIQDVPLNIPDPALEGFQKTAHEKLRGDVFMIEEPLLEKAHETEGPTTLLLKSAIPEESQNEQEVVILTKTKILRKIKGDVVPESVKRSQLTITQASDGSSLLSFEEEERSPSVDEQVVRKDKLELEQRKTDKREKLGEMSKEVGSEEELVFSLLDLLRKLKSQ